MYALPLRFFPEFFPEFILYRIVLASIWQRPSAQNFLKVFVKDCQDRLHPIPGGPTGSVGPVTDTQSNLLNFGENVLDRGLRGIKCFIRSLLLPD